MLYMRKPVSTTTCTYMFNKYLGILRDHRNKKSEVLHFEMYPAHYKVLQMKNTMRRISAVNPVTMTNLDDSHYKHRETIMQCYCESTPCAASKDKWDRKENTGKSMKQALYCSMPKGTCCCEATSDSEKSCP